MKKKYLFKPYSKKFPKLFEKEKKRIIFHVSNDLIVEHVGSTAVPNLGGKGIIDIAIAAKKEEMEQVSNQLQMIGYELRAAWSSPDRLFLRTDLPDPDEETRRYHIHLMHPKAQEWKEMLFFRDYLKAHPEEAENYAEIKRKASAEVNEDGAKYRDIKAPLFKKILNICNSLSRKPGNKI